MAKFSYLPHDKYVVINEGDSVLRPIVLKLPDPPPLHLIDGYGLPPVEQKFYRKETPEKLQQIEKRARKRIEEYIDESKGNRANGYHVQKEFWRIIEDEKDSLVEELKWIKHNWWYLRYGYWFFNYGKPTWIPPFYFFFLNFYYMDEANMWPEYRDRDRRAEIVAWYAYTATETFKEIDSDGNAQSMEMKDLGNRVFFGTIEPKRRRGGATARAMSHGLYILMNTYSTRCEIIADTGKHAEKLFEEKLAPAWYHMPLWVKPVWDGDERPAKSIKLIHPKTVMKEECIGSEFGYTESSSERANDSRKLGYADHDEEGKGAVRAEVRTRWAINKETMAQNLIIFGYTDHPSTVEEMQDGGTEYHGMFNMSDFYVRKPSGQTLSGLLPFFTPAPDGMDGFIDPWGYSVIGKPTEDQIKYAPKGNTYVSINMGAKESLQQELNTYLNDGSYDKLQEYRKLLRKKPMDSTDCWKGTAGDMGYNIIKIDKAIVDSRYKKVYQGNFYWSVKDKVVSWIDDPRGRWLVSDFFVGRCNKWKTTLSNHVDPETGKRIIAKAPMDMTITTLGVDPFRGRTASQAQSLEFGENTNLSLGGGCVLLNPDSAINGNLPEYEWPTPKVMCTYLSRPTLDTYCEDMLMTAFYYGAPCIGERNTETMIDYFIKRGFAGYLIYLMGADGKIAPQPWVFSGGINSAPKADMINYTAQFIENHIHNVYDINLLNQLKTISSPDDYHKRDLATAFGWALYGYYKGFQKKIERLNSGRVIDLSKSPWLDPEKRKNPFKSIG